MKIVMTGPTGAIGMALLQYCTEHRIHVLAICHKGSKRSERLQENEFISVIQVDMEDYGCYADCLSRGSAAPLGEEQNLKKMRSWKALSAGKTAAFLHLAWKGTVGSGRDNAALQYENVGAALAAVRLAKELGCDAFIGAGSQAEYGRVEGKLCAGTPAFPETGYGIAKLCAGQMTRLLCGQLGIRHVWARILSVYGPYDGESAMIPAMLRRLMAGEVMQFTGAQQIWDYLYSADAAAALAALAEKGRNGGVYCLGSGQEKPLKHYIEICAQAVWENRCKNAAGGGEQESLPQFMERCVKIGVLDYQPQQVMYLCADLTELTEDTGYIPQTRFEEGIKKTIEMMDRNGDM